MASFSFTAKDKPNAQDLNRDNVHAKRYSQGVARKVSEAITALPADAVEIHVSVAGETADVSHVNADGSRTEKSYTSTRTDMPAGDAGSVSLSSKPGNVPTSAIVGTTEGLIREDTHGDLSKGFDKRDDTSRGGSPGDLGRTGSLRTPRPDGVERRVADKGLGARTGPDDGKRRFSD